MVCSWLSRCGPACPALQRGARVARLLAQTLVTAALFVGPGSCAALAAPRSGLVLCMVTHACGAPLSDKPKMPNSLLRAAAAPRDSLCARRQRLGAALRLQAGQVVANGAADLTHTPAARAHALSREAQMRRTAARLGPCTFEGGAEGGRARQRRARCPPAWR